MKPDDFTIPTGQSRRKVRDFLAREHTQEFFTRRSVVRHFGADITDDLITHGLIEPFQHRGEREDLFQVAALGARLANARLMARIDRAKAQGIVDAFLERVRQVNARAELLYRVRKVHAFGSFITDAPHLGDIDLAIELQSKRDQIMQAKGDWIAANRARAKASGRTVKDEVHYGEIEVRRLLKSRNPYLSFHGFDELVRLGCKSKRIY
jgi:predicted LPLAT superfamily acyltransferase